MNLTTRVMVFLVSVFSFLSLSTTAYADWHEKDIVHQQAVTKLLKRGDVRWGELPDSSYNYYKDVQVSAGGSKVLFAVGCASCDPGEIRPFLMNPDGSDLQDHSGMLPDDITSPWDGWRNLAINDDASKIFFRASVETGYYDDHRIYVYDVDSSTRSLALNQQNIGSLTSDWRFRIDETGSKVFLDKINDGYDDYLEKNREGLFYALTGGTKNWYLDVDTLDCAPPPYGYCGYLNLFELLGVSVRNDRAFFRWDSNWTGNANGDPTTGFWYTGLDGNAVLLTDEHVTISDGDVRGISNAEGSKAIYTYRHASPDILRLAVVDVPSGTESVVGWTSSLNGFSAHMTRSGRYILTKGAFGDYGTYYQTMIDLQTGKSRDTWSYYLPTMGGSNSNITEDDRYYFHTIDGWPNGEDDVGLYRIDMQTQGDSQAPHVQQIAFDSPVLPDIEDATIGVRVTITDLQGIDNIDWVRLTPLVEGQEEPAWAMGREPLAFPTGDPGSTLLYDDGTHGDETEGDGIFSFDSIATRKGGREEGEWNTWYRHYTLPAPVGIRIIVKDKDNNYAIADTELVISKTTETPVATIVPMLYLLLQ